MRVYKRNVSSGGCDETAELAGHRADLESLHHTMASLDFLTGNINLRDFARDPGDEVHWSVYSVLGVATGRSGKSVWDHSKGRKLNLSDGALRLGNVVGVRQKTLKEA